jgi:3-oxoacyl-[acyl-carrier protein] reductase
MLNSIDGRSVIVTGASKGIGKGIAKVFASKGARILVAARSSKFPHERFVAGPH